MIAPISLLTQLRNCARALARVGLMAGAFLGVVRYGPELGNLAPRVQKLHATHFALPALVAPALEPSPLRKGQTYFKEFDGRIVLEAEHFDGQLARAKREWRAERARPGAAGDGYVVAYPRADVVHWDFAERSAQLSFRVRFDHPGRYRVDARGFAEDELSNSVHVGLDGAVSATSAHLSTRAFGRWTWLSLTMEGGRATLDVPSRGFHTVQVWMREGGFALDQLTLTRDELPESVAAPAELAESERGTAD